MYLIALGSVHHSMRHANLSTGMHTSLTDTSFSHDLRKLRMLDRASKTLFPLSTSRSKEYSESYLSTELLYQSVIELLVRWLCCLVYHKKVVVRSDNFGQELAGAVLHGLIKS